MSKPKKRDGAVYARSDGEVLWIRYWDRNGKAHRESTHTVDWDEANRKLRERLHHNWMVNQSAVDQMTALGSCDDKHPQSLS